MNLRNMSVNARVLGVSVVAASVFLGLAKLGSFLAPSWETRMLPESETHDSLPPFPASTAADEAAAEKTAIRRQAVHLPVSGTTLEGRVFTPAEAGRHPGVVLLPGAGMQSWEALVHEAEHFARAGIAALVYDKRSVGYSFVNVDYELLAEDALAGVDLLRERNDVDPTRVGLWGISEGSSWVAPTAAARAPSTVAFAILVSSAGTTPLRQLLWWLDSGLRRLHAPYHIRDAARRLLASGQFDYASFDPRPLLKRVDQPVLAVYGSSDKTVPPVTGARNLSTALEDGGNRSYTVRFFRDAGHNLRTDDGSYAPGYFQTMARWVNELPDVARNPRIAGAAPLQRYDLGTIPETPWYGNQHRTLLIIAALGFLAAPLSAAVARRRRARHSPGTPTTEAAAWRLIRRRARWLATSAIATQVASPLVVAGAAALALASAATPALSGVGGTFLVNGAWLVVRLGALATVVLLFVTVDAAVHATHSSGWRPSPVQAVSLAGTILGATVVLLLAAYWGMFALSW